MGEGALQNAFGVFRRTRDLEVVPESESPGNLDIVRIGTDECGLVFRDQRLRRRLLVLVMEHDQFAERIALLAQPCRVCKPGRLVLWIGFDRLLELFSIHRTDATGAWWVSPLSKTARGLRR